MTRVLALALLLGGCTLSAAQMTPEQLHEFAKVKDAHGGCTKIGTPYGSGVVVWGNADKGVIGKITVKCDGQELTIEGPAPKP